MDLLMDQLNRLILLVDLKALPVSLLPAHTLFQLHGINDTTTVVNVIVLLGTIISMMMITVVVDIQEVNTGTGQID